MGFDEILQLDGTTYMGYKMDVMGYEEYSMGCKPVPSIFHNPPEPPWWMVGDETIYLRGIWDHRMGDGIMTCL